jgi:hypothetical protein
MDATPEVKNPNYTNALTIGSRSPRSSLNQPLSHRDIGRKSALTALLSECSLNYVRQHAQG